MTEVICWSMKMRMVANRAGAKASGADHQGFWIKPYGNLGSKLKLSSPVKVYPYVDVLLYR